MTDAKDQELDPRVEQAIDDAKAAADRASREAAGTLDAMKQAAVDAAQRGAAAVSDAADHAKSIAEDSLGKAGGVVEGAKSAASDAKAAAGKAVDAAADVAKAAGAKLKDAADEVDLDELVTQTRTLAGEWTERLKQAYRERPGVVIGAAVGVVVVTAAIVRAIGRR